MTLEEFIESISKEDHPPQDISNHLQALWYDGKGYWDESHDIIQDDPGREAAWIHAYLHRKEGDEWNAGYWYRRAGKDPCPLSVKEEWKLLVEYFISRNH